MDQIESIEKMRGKYPRGDDTEQSAETHINHSSVSIV